MKHLNIPDNAGHILLPIARSTIENTLNNHPFLQYSLPPWVHEQGACFITLTQTGHLRGCIGTIIAHQSLLQDVQTNAVNAAIHDPRFPPLQATELPKTRVELSILSAIEPMTIQNEPDALAQLRPGIDGIVLKWHHHQSTFLPQVWEQLPSPIEFLGHLKNKAGLAADFWDDNFQLSRYTVSKWIEK